MRWFSADHHFNHRHVIDYCKRPFDSVEHMNEELIRRWNMLVQPADEVLYCGDFSFGNATQIKSVLKRLNGVKFLIRGNHDKGRTDTWLRGAGFATVHPWVCVMIGSEPCVVSHYPYREHRHDDREFSDMRSDEGRWLIHGHVHTEWKQRGRMINVGVDQWSYAPVSEQEIRHIIEPGAREGR